MSDMIKLYSDGENKKVFLKIETMADDIRYEIDQAFAKVGQLMRDRLRKGLRFGSRTGRVYRHYNAFKGTSFFRTSSAPGEFPQRIRGILKDSVAYNVYTRNTLYFGIKNPGKYGIDTTYAQHLEEGTVKMKPRLLVGYIVEKTNAEARNIIIKRVNKAIKTLGV